MRKTTHMMLIVTSLFFFSLAAGLGNNSFTEALQTETNPTYQKFAGIPRPDPDGVPTKVQVGVVFLDVTKIDDVNQTFNVDFFLIYRWADKRLDVSNDPFAPAVRIYGLDEIWNPELAILNQRNLKDYYDEIFRVDAYGNVQYQQRYFGELSSPLDLKDFCFDRQILPIQIVSVRYSPEEMELSALEQLTGRGGQFSIAGWTIDLEKTQSSKMYLAFQNRDLARIDFPLSSKRHSGYYLMKLLIPLSLIVFMAWSVFWIDPTALGPQIALPTSAVFTFILFNFRIGQLLPKISYLTRIDRFVLGATFLVFMALGEAITTTMLARKGKEKLARRIDRMARYLYLLLFAIVIAVAFLV